MGQFADLDSVRFGPDLDPLPEKVAAVPPRLWPFDAECAIERSCGACANELSTW
jgi:hypothetical protein